MSTPTIFSLEPLPAALAALRDAPKALYAVGDPALLHAPVKIAVVGSRRAYRPTLDAVRLIASAIADAGGVVLSGAAMGVDAAAHEGAGAASTIAVMGNSLDLFVPAVNRRLIEQIYARGLALSEYPATTPATRYSFVRRNRLVAGLADIVVVAQADEKSGSIQTAQMALALGKPLFVLPHRLGESLGTNRLLAEGKARPLADIPLFLEACALTVQTAAATDDPFRRFCATAPTYDEALRGWGERLFEAELSGLIEIRDGKVYNV